VSDSGIDPGDGSVRRAPSMRTRLVLALAGVSVFTLVVVGIVFYAFLGSYVLDRQSEELRDRAVEIAERMEGLAGSFADGRPAARVINLLLRIDLRSLPADAGIVVFVGDEPVADAGTVPVKKDNLERLRVAGEEVVAAGTGVQVVRSLADVIGRSAGLVVAAAPIDIVGEADGVVVVTLATTDAFAARGGLARLLVIAGVIALAVAVAVGLGLGSWMARPLRRLSLAARTMARGFYDRPVTGTYPGEVQELAGSLETMRREVVRSEESLRGFVASAAHELRTPLTSIQGFSQALLDGTAATPEQQQRAAAAVYRESARLQRLVDALLTLSRYDSGEFRPDVALVRVETLVSEEVDRLVQVGIATPGQVTVRAGGNTDAHTDADMLRQVVGNLLRNAVQYGGDDPIEARVRVEDGRMVVEVESGGEPLDQIERLHVFDRFYRGSAGRKAEGLGLGLALVREICTVLGGNIELVGRGPETVFRVTLPAHQGEV